MKKDKIKVYIYTRVSTTIQVDGYSLDAQKARMKAFAEYNDYKIVGEYEDATDIIGLKQNPTNGRRFSPIFLVIGHFLGHIR